MVSPRNQLQKRRVMTYVIIPAYNEEDTIGPLVARFLSDVRSHVIVIIDSMTADATIGQLPKHRRLKVMRSPYHGKGQNITLALPQICGKPEVVLCDADVTITPGTVNALMRPLTGRIGQRIVVPKPPTEPEWRAAEAAAEVRFDRTSWPWVSGIRRVRTHLIPPTIYGYLTEVLINKMVNGSVTTPYTMFSYDIGTIAPLRFTPERVQDMKEHGTYGKQRGLI
jgi:glycosyltransferase involved in cell wall biosynthesis